MGKEETPQATRRTRRSLALATFSNNGEEKTRKGVTHKPTINDLMYGDESISLEDLLSSFPGRHSQITEVLRHLGPLNSPMLPLFIYGGASTGKTSIILQIFKHLKRPFVYSSCITCYSPRILFESILNQLALHVRDEDNGYSNAKKCEKPSDFTNFLREALVNILDTLKGNPPKSSLKKKSAHDMGNMIYLMIDNLELLREWDKSSTILPFLFGLYRTLGLPEVGIIFISKASPDTYYSNSGHLEPVPVYFPAYTENDLREIFMQKQANKELYSSFLDIVLKPFYRVTRRVDELTTSFSPLYKKYCQPLDDPGSIIKKSKQKREEDKRRLFGHIAPHIGSSLNEVFRISYVDAELNTDKTKGRTGSEKSRGHDEELGFHMSISAKYLLLSAFLASRNPATLDASLFDATGGLDGRKKKRKCSEKTLEQKEAAEQELLLKGPGTFPLERLFAIFQCIASVAQFSLDEDLQDNDPLLNEVGNIELTSDVLLQLSSLCNANFISKGGSCPLEGSTRYKSIVSEELALKIARSLKFPLSRYLYRR